MVSLVNIVFCFKTVPLPINEFSLILHPPKIIAPVNAAQPPTP